MRHIDSNSLQFALRLLACVLILKVTAVVVIGYRNYLPPNFHADFLQGRQAYFWNGYHWAFYLHIASGPCALVLGTALLSDRLRRRRPSWHRNLGRIQTAIVLLAVAPSGLWMAFYTQMDSVLAESGFAALGISTGLSAALGYRAAVRRRFDEHRRWMSRCFLLLCSAVLLRLIGGAFTVAGYEGDWTYILAAWLSWLAPLAVFELSESQLISYARSAGTR